MTDRWNIIEADVLIGIQPTFRNDSRITWFRPSGEVQEPSFLSKEEEQEVIAEVINSQSNTIISAVEPIDTN